ncbi:MAG: hypothetical protein HN368_07170 [Spirochaetales bacterium]|nr:hypothetical protein [Spirochaetales bacterium]
MEQTKSELEKKKARLEELLVTRSEASCDTRHLSPADVQREQEIEDLEDEIAELEG